MQNGVCSAYCIGKGGRDTRDCNMNAHRIHIAADYRKANPAENKKESVNPLKTQRFYAFLHHGEHGIRTHAPVTRPNAFRVRPLEPLG